MELHIEAPFHDELELPEEACGDLEGVLLAASAGALHAEDALLAAFTHWIGVRGASACERQAAIELARDALDLVGDPDGPWQALPVERWLTEAARKPRCAGALRQLPALARAFVSWLGDQGRLSLHAQRLLARRIGAARTGASVTLAA